MKMLLFFITVLFCVSEIEKNGINAADSIKSDLNFLKRRLLPTLYRHKVLLSPLHRFKIISSGNLQSPKNDEAQDFDKLREECLQNGNLFEDSEFDAVDSSLFFNESRASEYSSLSWLRPHDIQKNPKLIVDGASRFDITQGSEGDCWFNAVLSMVAANETLFSQIVPSDQSFDDKYCGIFHFRFMQMGHWVDVVVDDRLPTKWGEVLQFTGSSTPNEFWSALLEKAYAKLYGSYEALYDGEDYEAMEDLTGGVATKFVFDDLLPVPNFFKWMDMALARQSLIAADIVIDDSKEEDKLFEKGLVNNHAYSITSVRYVNMSTPKKTETVKLVRIRNPWGNEREWKGPWSDNSPEWNYVSEEVKKELGFKKANDGEFWMTYHDFIHTFVSMTFCLINPNILPENPSGLRWEVSVFQGEWVRGISSGGSSEDTLHENPQYRVKLEAGDDGHCVIYVALMQHSQRALRNFLKRNSDDYLRVGFIIYKLNDTLSVPHPLSAEYIQGHKWYETSLVYSQLREVSGRFHVPPGVYVIIPSTHDPDEEGEFVLRIVTEKKHHNVNST